jgi:hypothetical protein
MPRFSAVSSALSWDAKNGAALVARHRGRTSSWTTVRYEDLAGDPSGALDEVLTACGRATDRRPDLDQGGLVVGELHTIGGNPSKGARTRIEITEDHEWRTSIDRRTEAVTTLLCAPLMWRFGYDLGRRSGSGTSPGGLRC